MDSVYACLVAYWPLLATAGAVLLAGWATVEHAEAEQLRRDLEFCRARCDYWRAKARGEKPPVGLE